MKRAGRWLLALLALVLAAVAAYVAYACLAYYRLEDRLPLTVENGQSQLAQIGRPYSLITYNLGFGAYSADYSFFMDGGKESRAFSQEAVRENIAGALSAVGEPDLLLFQEVDVDSDRSYHVDEAGLLRDWGQAYAAIFAQNYDSPYLFWPLLEPHGKSRSGMMTLSSLAVSGALRRSLPVEEGAAKFLDLDRCYTVTRVRVEGERTLCLYNVHLSAYTSDGSIATRQLQLLLADMAAEYAAGNYVVCGGDFNKDLLGDSAAVFGVSGEAATWAQAFPFDLVPGELTLAAPLDPVEPVPSCRNADAPYRPGESFVLTVDGFLVSDNVGVRSVRVLDTQFAWSDHQPVELEFVLK